MTTGILSLQGNFLDHTRSLELIKKDYILSVVEIAKKKSLKVHVDGARIFNASAALGVSPSDLNVGIDSVSFCLSKGLSAPIGSLLCGPKKFIEKARREADGQNNETVKQVRTEEDIEKERQSALGVTKAEGKPEAAWEKIVEGRVSKWLSERVLLEQGMFGEKETVAQKLGNGSITNFVQAYIGE